MITITATIYYEGAFWVGSFERTDKTGYAVARWIFGDEPSDTEVHNFILNNYEKLHFGAPQEFKLEIKRMNPKRVQREVKREMERLKETSKPSTLAQDYIREEQEKNKKEKKQKTKAAKEAHEEKLFLMKQQKRKEKHRGH